MPKLRLSFISAFNERVDPLMKGIVQAEGIEIVPTYSHPSETFWRQLKFQEFEVGEMSMSSYLIARERGFDIIALPVFPSRRLFHTELSYHTDSGIKEPRDLIGKRIGVGEYQQTAALWQRGILEHDFGVSQYKVHWYMERTEELSHGGATGFTPPPGISFQRIPPDKSMASMLVNNELDVAAINSPWKDMPNVIGRSHQIPGGVATGVRSNCFSPIAWTKASVSSKSGAFFLSTTRTRSAAISTKNIPGSYSICTRALSRRRNISMQSSSIAFPRRSFSAASI